MFKASFDMVAINGSKTLQKFATEGAERLIQVELVKEAARSASVSSKYDEMA